MTKLIATTAAALLAGTALAAAQGMGNRQEGAAPAPSVQRSAPAEKMAPAQQPSAASQAKPAETTGQAPREPSAAPSAGSADTKIDSKSSTDMKANDQKSSMDNKSSADTKAGADQSNKAASDTNASGKANDQKAAQDSKTTTKTTTTGQGAAGARGAANLSTEQKTKIRTVIKEKVKAQPVTNVNFSISVGTKVPRTVHFYPLPAEVVTIYPEWRGYNFILVGDEIVIIEPATYEIVAVIAA